MDGTHRNNGHKSALIDFPRVRLVMLEKSDAMNNVLDKSFDCSNPDYTKYLKFDSLYDTQENLARTYMLMLDGKVLGFVSLAMSYVRKDNTAKMKSKASDYNIPCLLISHLAVDRRYERQGVGTALVNVAIKKAIFATRHFGCRYLILHPEDDDGVREFYKKCGFDHIEHLVEDNKEVFVMDINTKSVIE